MKRLIFVAILTFSLYSCSSTTHLRDGELEAYYMEGIRAYHESNPEYAEDCFRRVLKVNPKHDGSLYYLANMKYNNGQYEESLKYMTAATEADPSNYWYQTQQAQLLLSLDRVNEAIAVYEQLCALYPQKKDLSYDLANLYMNNKDTEKALLLLDDIEKVGGISEATGYYRFTILMMQGKKEQARPLITQLSEEYNSPRLFSILGDMYGEEGKDTLALANYDRATALESDYMPAIFGQAEVYRVRQQYDLYFEKMSYFMADPKVNTKMKVDYLDQLMKNRSFVGTFLQQVDTMFVNLRTGQPTDSSVAYLYAGFLVQSDRSRDALRVLKENVGHYSQDQVAWSQYLSLIYFMQDWEMLYDTSQQAIDIFPKVPDYINFRGLAAWQLKKLPEAIACFESVLSLAKGNKSLTLQTYSILGDLYHAAGDAPKAYKAYEKALDMDPNQISVLNNYAYYLALEGKKLEKAYEMSKKTIDAEPQNSTYLDTFGWILFLQGKFQEAKSIFRQVMVYGSKENSEEVLDHYAEVLYALKEYDMAFIYWEQAKTKDSSGRIGKKIEERKAQMQK